MNDVNDMVDFWRKYNMPTLNHELLKLVRPQDSLHQASELLMYNECIRDDEWQIFLKRQIKNNTASETSHFN